MNRFEQQDDFEQRDAFEQRGGFEQRDGSEQRGGSEQQYAFEQQYASEIGRVFNQTALLPGSAAVTPGQIIRFDEKRPDSWKPEPPPVGRFEVLETGQGMAAARGAAVGAVAGVETGAGMVAGIDGGYQEQLGRQEYQGRQEYCGHQENRGRQDYRGHHPHLEEEPETPNYRFANASIYWELTSENTMSIRMPVPGSLFFLAIECSVYRLSNRIAALKALKHLKKELWWKEAYLVTGLTIAKRALIVQSASEDCRFELEGKLAELISRGGARLRESDNLTIRNARGTAMEISWQQNLPIVMETMPLYRSTISRLVSSPGLKPSPIMVYSFFSMLKSLVMGSADAEVGSTK